MIFICFHTKLYIRIVSNFGAVSYHESISLKRDTTPKTYLPLSNLAVGFLTTSRIFFLSIFILIFFLYYRQSFFINLKISIYEKHKSNSLDFSKLWHNLYNRAEYNFCSFYSRVAKYTSRNGRKGN